MEKFLKTKEDFLQYKYLNIPLNVDESGYTRYGAAMYFYNCLLYTSPSPRDRPLSRMPSSA